MSHEFQGPILSKPTGRLGRRAASTDAVCGLVCGGVLPDGSDYDAFGQIVKLIQPADAEALGINAAYDANNDVLVYHHIKQFFHYNPDGTLYLMLVAQGTSLTNICDKANNYLRKLLADESTNGEIRMVGVVLNPASAPLLAAFTTGLLTDVTTAVPKAQDLVDTLRTESAIFCDSVILEGLLYATAAIATLPAVRDLTSENVSVCIAAEPAVISATSLHYAAIGAALGMLSIRKVSECLGSVDIARKPEAAKGSESYPLTSAAKGYFLSACLSNGKLFSALAASEKAALATKGYIYAGRFEGFDGFYFNDSHTCASVSSDYAYIEDNRVWGKAARLLRRALIPVIRGEVEVDPKTGFLPGSQIAFYQAKGKKGVAVMAADGELSGEPSIIIEPNQNVVGTGTVKMALAYVRKGILRRLEAEVAAINPAAS